MSGGLCSVSGRVYVHVAESGHGGSGESIRCGVERIRAGGGDATLIDTATRRLPFRGRPPAGRAGLRAYHPARSGPCSYIFTVSPKPSDPRENESWENSQPMLSEATSS